MRLPALLTLLFFAIVFSANAQFVTIWDTSIPGLTGNTQINFNRATSGFFNYSFVKTDDASVVGSGSLNGFSPTITFPVTGRYQVTLNTAFNNIQMGGNGDGNKLVEIVAWGNVAWSSMSNAFSGCSNLVVTAPDSPNLSSCTSIRQMFEAAPLVTGAGFENWNVGNVQDFTNTFAGATTFNGAIGTWDMHSATTLFAMFAGATLFDQDLSAWNVSNVTNMRSMFAGSAFNHNINSWNTSNVTDFVAMFYNATSFNQPLSNWDVTSCNDLDQMFSGATSFNQNINSWNVSNCNNFALMFNGASTFNQPLNNWNMSSSSYVWAMFQDAAAFNQDISGWDMSNNTTLDQMFSGATKFNQDISGWNVSKVTGMYGTFYGASAFNQNLSKWDVSQVLDMSDIFHNSGLSNGNYDNALIGWAKLALQPSVTIGAQTNTYCAAKNDRDDIIADYGWFFFDGGEYCGPEITSFTPTSAHKGEKVIIKGFQFTDANLVSFGDVNAASYTVDDANTISAIIADGETGTVAVTTPLGTGTLNGFVYLGEQKGTAIIVVKNGDDNTGTTIGDSEAIDLGTTSQNKALVKSFSISNSGTVSDTVATVFVGSPFEVVEVPGVIQAGSFERLTISLDLEVAGNYSSDIIVTFASGGRIAFKVSAKVDVGDLIVYNAVTPNGDGAHDFLKLLNIENYPGNKVVILDRLGNEVFTVNDYDNSNSAKRFEGVSNKGGGRNLTDGTYFYVISANNKKYTGFLLLQR